MMKWLIGLSAVQTVLLVFVGMRVVALEMRADDIADSADAARLAAQHSAQTRPTSTLVMPASGNGAEVDMEAFRALIREEIAPIAAAQTRQATRTASAPVMSPDQLKRAQADFTRDLNLARSRTHTSEAEISDLYAQIAKMPPSSRQAAMTEIARAFSNGEINAKL